MEPIKNFKIGPKIYRNYRELDSKYSNFGVRSDDVWMYGLARSGTTLTQEMVWLLCNDLNYEKGAEQVLNLRFPFFEDDLIIPQKYKIFEDFLENKANKGGGDADDDDEMVKLVKQLIKPATVRLNEMTNERRFIKTHLPISLTPPQILTEGCKVIYVYRDPKSVIISTYKLLTRFLCETDENFYDFWQRFKNNDISYSPFPQHVKEGWELRNKENFLFFNYDDCLNNIGKAIRTMANFLNKQYSEEDYKKLEEHLSIKNFKNNKSVNNDYLIQLGVVPANDVFIGKGGKGKIKDLIIDDDLENEINQWIKDNYSFLSIK